MNEQTQDYEGDRPNEGDVVERVAATRGPAKSWAPEMFAEGSWTGNAVRFATREEAEEWGRALLMRWFVPTDSRAVESTDPVNYRLVDGSLEEVKAE